MRASDRASSSRTWETAIRESVVPRAVIDRFLQEPGWARFDAELGYVPQDSALEWGAGGVRAVETFDADGSRSGLRFRGARPRINCYGDSFTEGTHLSDGETWEEYLASHLGEPIGNYGVGGYGTYQAYRRMLRQEGTSHGADLVVLYHLAHSVAVSMARTLWVLMARDWKRIAASRPTFHGTFRPTLEIDLHSGRFVERENPLRTRDSLYRMCDPEWMVEALRDDLASQLEVFAHGGIDELDRAPVDALASALGTRFDWAGDRRREARLLSARYGERAVIETLDRVRAFADSRGKQLLVALNMTTRETADGVRDDQDLVDHLAQNGFRVFDMNLVHAAERAKTTLGYDEYLAQFLIPDAPAGSPRHSARGNHLFAYAIKDSIVEALGRKPPAYRHAGGMPPLAEGRGGPSRAALDDHWLGDLLVQLRDRFAEPWTAESIAALASRSRSSLYDRFVAAMNIPPLEYVKELRLQEASRLVLGTDLPVGEIGRRVGFASDQAFARAFARRYGAPPLRYRHSRRAVHDAPHSA